MPINRSALKTYAPKARKDFIAAMVARVAKFGISKKEILEAREQGDVVIIGAEAFPRKVGTQRRKLIARIKLHGFDQTMEEVAYTWFNRLLAIRYMELHGYLDHGYRVLSHPAGKKLPEILEHAEHLDFAGLNKNKVIDLKLDGTKDAELYRLLLIAQCNALNTAMPFLFERIDDETELLLPDNLLHTDSLIRKLVTSIDETDWQEIEIIGWLYQFYISEKKDQVIGKVVKSEDIPAATQLFTPNWIVKYMVQNSLGAQWLATYPDSSLKAQMEYYIEPAEQNEEVKRQLDDITPKELNPEELTLMDPACGSGHILVEAYDLFKAIYLERGYRLRDIPRLILENNLHGLDIDERAAQMAGFALLMKARADDRRILSPDNPPVLSVLSIQDSRALDADEIARTLMSDRRAELISASDLLPDTIAQPFLSNAEMAEVIPSAISALIDLFADAKIFGSLIIVPDQIQQHAQILQSLLESAKIDDLYKNKVSAELAPLIKQANLLARKYDSVVANPPYMGLRKMPQKLKKFVQSFKNSKHQDLYSVFLEQSIIRLKGTGRSGFVAMQGWAFFTSFESTRSWLLNNSTLSSLVHMGAKAFPEISGEVVQVTAAVCNSAKVENFIPVAIDATSKEGLDKRQCLSEAEYRFEKFSQNQYLKMPNKILAFNMPEKLMKAFAERSQVEDFADIRQGLATTDDNSYLRTWQEISFDQIALYFETPVAANAKGYVWFPFNKGGSFRKWYGNNEFIVKYENDGEDLLDLVRRKYPRISDPEFVIKNRSYYCRPGLTWSNLSGELPGFRIYGKGFLFGHKGSGAFPKEGLSLRGLAAFMNSSVAAQSIRLLSVGLDYNVKQIESLPFIGSVPSSVIERCDKLIDISKADWDANENSWDFASHPLLSEDADRKTVRDALFSYMEKWSGYIDEVKELEEKNNEFFIDAYRLRDDFSYEVPPSQITLTNNPHFRFKAELSDWERNERWRSDIISDLVSYSVGCMMGRYSLAKPGLIYANSGNEGFDPSSYGDFPADEDGIIPITQLEWFDDDAAVRFEEFLKVAWTPETVRENLRFVAESLVANGENDPEKAIRTYFSKSFFKDHLKTYKKRPIYWLFSSGKLKAFECLVYLHRYNEGTISRMRMEYVTPLQSRMSARIDSLDHDIAAASSSAARTKAQKEKDLMVKQLEELRTFDEELRHYADQRITLDLDDGVKVNYGKFGNLLAERKAITGEKG